MQTVWSEYISIEWEYANTLKPTFTHQTNHRLFQRNKMISLRIIVLISEADIDEMNREAKRFPGENRLNGPQPPTDRVDHRFSPYPGQNPWSFDLVTGRTQSLDAMKDRPRHPHSNKHHHVRGRRTSDAKVGHGGPKPHKARPRKRKRPRRRSKKKRRGNSGSDASKTSVEGSDVDSDEAETKGEESESAISGLSGSSADRESLESEGSEEEEEEEENENEHNSRMRRDSVALANMFSDAAL